ncbi:MAG: GNAT family N-acetyltransferase [Acidobacteriota bacterium]|nr:GNAT family N-acetyltransferase [Acidobacteriota bacterium]
MTTPAPPETPTLTGRLVRLEPLGLHHLPALEAVALDPRIWRYMLVDVRTPQQLRSWLEAALAMQASGNALPWATVVQATGQVVGSTRFVDLDRKHGTVELGHTWIAPALHGSGLNPEAKLLQLTYAFETLGLRRVALKTHHENLQSQAAMRKMGATQEGIFRNHFVMPDGSQRHSVWFSITREDWPQVKAALAARAAAYPLPSA